MPHEMIEHYDATRKHVQRVQHFMVAFANELVRRALMHDESKYGPEEASHFARVLPKLAATTYGSEEYKAMLREISPAIHHHQQNNSHHPEFYTNGIEGMTLLDFVEMFCDWKAASERHNDGDMRQSIEKNTARFGMTDAHRNLMLNTIPWMNGVAGDTP